MKKNLWIAILCGLCAVLFLGVCSAFADDPLFIYYENNDYDEHMKPIDNEPIRFSVTSNGDGTYDLALFIHNVSDRSWSANKYTLLCKRGSDMLVEGSGPSWTIDTDVPRGTRVEMHATLKEYKAGARMVFYIMDGSNSITGFYIRL